MLLPAVEFDLNAHLNRIQVASREKGKCRNRDAKSGRPIHKMLENDDNKPSVGKSMSDDELDAVDAAMTAYWAEQYRRDPENIASPWEIDPLVSDEQKAAREHALSLLHFDAMALDERYVAYRNVTEALRV